MSITIASTPDLIKAFDLSTESSVTPIAAATLNLPYLSLHALGRNLFLIISLKVISPTNLFSALIIGNFSILFFFRIFSAFSISVKFAVTIYLLVITDDIGRVISFSNLKSLLVTIPKS